MTNPEQMRDLMESLDEGQDNPYWKLEQQLEEVYKAQKMIVSRVKKLVRLRDEEAKYSEDDFHFQQISYVVDHFDQLMTDLED